MSIYKNKQNTFARQSRFSSIAALGALVVMVNAAWAPSSPPRTDEVIRQIVDEYYQKQAAEKAASTATPSSDEQQATAPVPSPQVNAAAIKAKPRHATPAAVKQKTVVADTIAVSVPAAEKNDLTLLDKLAILGLVTLAAGLGLWRLMREPAPASARQMGRAKRALEAVNEVAADPATDNALRYKKASSIEARKDAA